MLQHSCYISTARKLSEVCVRNTIAERLFTSESNQGHHVRTANNKRETVGETDHGHTNVDGFENEVWVGVDWAWRKVPCQPRVGLAPTQNQANNSDSIHRDQVTLLN